MSPPWGEERGTFRRNVIIVAALHVAVIAGLWLFSLWKKEAPSGENVTWLDGGGFLAGTQAAQPTPAPEDTPDEPDDTPTPAPTPDKEAMSTPIPQATEPPSQITLPTPTVAPTPLATPTPTPEPTATPTPKPTPKTTPKPSPKPKPKTSPKPKPKSSASPKKHSSPRPSPHKSPKPDQDDGDDDKPTKSAKNAFKHATGHGGGADDKPGTAPGSGGGNHGGKGHAGGGDKEGDFGWYNEMLHERFNDRWVQPTNIVTADSNIATQVKIRISKDGAISDVSLAKSSGNDVMDQSVMEAARHVTQVDPLPQGLGAGGSYEVIINFGLNHQSQ